MADLTPAEREAAVEVFGEEVVRMSETTPLQWSQLPPNEPGWYWFRNRIGATGIQEFDRSLIERARAAYLRFKAGEVDFAYAYAGPIPEPTEVQNG